MLFRRSMLAKTRCLLLASAEHAQFLPVNTLPHPRMGTFSGVQQMTDRQAFLPVEQFQRLLVLLPVLRRLDLAVAPLLVEVILRLVPHCLWGCPGDVLRIIKEVTATVIVVTVG